MSFTAIDWPTEALYFEMEVDLSGVPYRIEARWNEARLLESSAGWVLKLSTLNNQVIEDGMRLVAGARFAWRRAEENKPKGTLSLMASNGVTMPDIPSIEDMQQGRVLLTYHE